MATASFVAIIPRSLIFYLCCVSLCLNLIRSRSAAQLSSESDKEALLSLKSRVSSDPFGALSQWNDSTHFCNWNGVLCSRGHERVTAINLATQNLTGTISPYVGNLTFLRRVNLRRNFFHGEIPREIGRLYRLRSLGFTLNHLQGTIPVEISNCSRLVILDLVSNNLEGTIPEEIGRISSLIGLGLAVNNLTGSIPGSISNLTALTQLSLSENTLRGDIPSELGSLKNLNMFQVSANQFLTGSIPLELFNMSFMDYFGVSQNQLTGEVPQAIGFSLPKVRILLMDGNSFTGRIPVTIANATKLEWLFLSQNNLTGPIPSNLGNLKNLTRLNLGMNNLGTGTGNDLDFLYSLQNCTSLEVLAINNNSLGGVLPGNIIANLSTQLSFLLMGANRISGQIPSQINRFQSLILIGMEENLFAGAIPDSIGYLKNLQVLSIFGNRFSGKIPDTLGNLSSLVELGLNHNDLEGSIPSSLGGCLQLQRLDLSRNSLSGSVPKQVMGLSSLSDWLDLSVNKLTGLIPGEIGNLGQLRLLDLSDNGLSGEVPSSIRSCDSLEKLYLQGNFFQGPIPSSLKYVKGIQELDLSRNNFTGRIPDFLGSLPFLTVLNLSFNDLEGEVPSNGNFRNMSVVSVTGNDKLCGGIPRLGLQHCPIVNPSKKLWQRSNFRIIVAAICVPTCLVFLAFAVIIIVKRKKAKENIVEDYCPSLDNKFQKITYSELSLITDGFSSANLIGTGSYGSVYIGCMQGHGEEFPVAVKVFDLQKKGATKSFVAECESLRNIRHRNLVKIITSCSSIDPERNEFKALVFEFMPNGSLDKWLHGSGSRRGLSFQERLSIAADVAHALDYLHNRAHSPVVHCDLKPSNILLDMEMVARVEDFGLAKLLYDRNVQVIHSSLSTNAFKGTIGYVAPEYGMAGEVSTRGDVYSFGILLLEMFTGKRPTDEMFMEDLSLHSFVQRAIPDRIHEVVEPTLLEGVLQNNQDCTAGSSGGVRVPRSKVEDVLVTVLKMGVVCSKELPGERMDMEDVTGKLQSIRDTILVRNL
ncbi:hypothetical protein SAY87_017261 [Trapa incisa]|uniref:non-specific serine/threonine protein kinase n=1 Tax=Trapa incisa TaxID=236973 RepID=A0AAN7LA37_9MYRT|nr:hypothetical protein SAY87_017261 [Trapa incisa]